MSSRRIGKELNDLAADTDPSGVSVKLAGDGTNVGNLEGSFPGPLETPYEGGTFHIEIKVPPDYPFKPPIMKFLTKIWHPNVSSQTVRSSHSVPSPTKGNIFSHADVYLLACCVSGSYMSRHPRLGMVAHPDNQIRSHLAAVASQLARAQ